MNVTAKQVSPIEMDALVRAYEYSLNILIGEVDVARAYDGNIRIVRYKTRNLIPFIDSGVDLARAVIAAKEIPHGQEKKLEMAVRVFTSVVTRPANPVAWFDKNENSIIFLKEAAKLWSDKTEGGNQMFAVGPFMVHNTMGLAGDDLDGIKNALQKAGVLLKGSSIPGVEHVLYGDVMIVGKLKKGTTVAWYYEDEDTVYVRPFKNAGFDELHSIIHELGHRYIRKFVNRNMWSEWVRYHTKIVYTRPSDTRMPGVGEELPFTVSGMGKSNPIVKRIDGDKFYITETGFITKSVIKNHIDDATKYPTAYSAKSEHEHFCEAMAHRVMGKLKEPNLGNFKSIVEDGKHDWDSTSLVSSQSVVIPMGDDPYHVAESDEKKWRMSMASTYVQISRDDLEEWLGTFRLHDKAHRVTGKAGIYMLPFSETVACKLSSTIGTSDDAIGRGMASMQLALVSRITGQTVNKKAQGQSHFARTTNWKKNWAEGVERMRDAYTKSAGFYDALAAIKDRDAYRSEILEAIQSVPSWQNNSALSGFHATVSRDGILTFKQIDLMDSIIENETRKPPESPKPAGEDPIVAVMRSLYVKAKAANDDWTMNWLKDVANQVKSGRPLTPNQRALIDKKRDVYKVAAIPSVVATRYAESTSF